MKLPSRIQFADEKIKMAFEELAGSGSQEKSLYQRLERAFRDIEENAFCGIQIPKRLIPKSYLAKKKVKNLWKYNLPDAWRLLYSIEHGKVYIVSIVLEWMSHKDYERRFKYG